MDDGSAIARLTAVSRALDIGYLDICVSLDGWVRREPEEAAPWSLRGPSDAIDTQRTYPDQPRFGEGAREE